MDAKFVKRFWRKVEKGNPSECWVWDAEASCQGYGLVSVEGRTKKAHRVSYEISRGPIPDGLHVLHSCDNRACVNPLHLRLGTNKDNVADRVRKGRSARLSGEKHGGAKISELDVKFIRMWRDKDFTLKEIARAFNLGIAQTFRITSGASWSHVCCLFALVSFFCVTANAQLCVEHKRKVPISEREFEAVGKLLSENEGRMCSGTLVAPRVVLTAGHCTELRKSDPMYFIAGGAKTLVVDSISLDENGSASPSSGQDVGLLRLAKEVPGLAPAAISETYPTFDTNVALVGYGCTSFCAVDGLLSTYGDYSKHVTRGLSHSYSPISNDSLFYSVCNGDSGGPLLDVKANKVFAVASAFTFFTNGKFSIFGRAYFGNVVANRTIINKIIALWSEK